MCDTSRKTSGCTSFFLIFFFNFPGTRLTCQVISSHTHRRTLQYSPHLPPFLLLCLTASSFHPGAWKPLQENCFQLCAVTGAQPPCSCSWASAPQTHRMGGEGLLRTAGCLQKQSPPLGVWRSPLDVASSRHGTLLKG